MWLAEFPMKDGETWAWWTLLASGLAGFGNFLTFACIWFGQPSRSLWQTLAIGGFVGWSTAVMVHPAIGSTDTIHLAPAVAGAMFFAVGLAFTHRAMFARAGAKV